MNKLTITIISTLLLSTAGLALAQDSYGEPGRKAQHHQRGPRAMPVVDQMMHALRQLDLSDEQKASAKAIMQAMKAEIRPLMEGTRADHEQLKELIKADSYDEKAVAALAEKEGNLAAERVKIASRAMSEVYSQLTAEQRDELDSMAAERQQRRSERREQRSGKS